MKPSAVVIASCVLTIIAGGCGSSTTTIETVITRQVAASPTGASPGGQGEAVEHGEGVENPAASSAQASQSEPRLTVPDELEMPLIAAAEDLASKGFAFKVVAHRAFGGGSHAGATVCAMRPSPGVSVARGTTIKLAIAPVTRPRCKAFKRLRLR